MSESTKELKRKLLTTFWVGDGEESDIPGDAVDVIKALEAEVDRLKGVLGEIVGTLKGAPDDEGVKALYDFASSTLEAKP